MNENINNGTSLGQTIAIAKALSKGGGGGTSDHSSLANLEYANSGHTGFASANALEGKQDKLIAGNNITIIDNTISSSGGGSSSTGVKSILYMNGQTLQQAVPSTQQSVPYVLNGLVEVTKRFTLTSTVDIPISDMSLYNTYIYLNGLSSLTGYQITVSYIIDGGVVVSTGSVTIRPATSNSLLSIPMNVNFLTSNVFTKNIILDITIKKTLIPGDGTINIQTGGNTISSFIRNGGDISAENVYTLWKDGTTKSQNQVNNLLEQSVYNKFLTIEKSISTTTGIGGIINEVYPSGFNKNNCVVVSFMRKDNADNWISPNFETLQANTDGVDSYSLLSDSIELTTYGKTGEIHSIKVTLMRTDI